MRRINGVIAHGTVLLCIVTTLGSLSACGAIKEKLDFDEESGEAEAMQQRRENCDAMHGTFSDVDVGACVDGQAVLTAGNERQVQPCIGGEQSRYEGQCLLRDESGLIYFCDGPSVPEALLNSGQDLGAGANLSTWNGFFWDAGVNHDYCYHHGAAVYGYTQADCDGQMLDDLVALCSQQNNDARPWFTRDRCTTNAQIMYAAVRAFGEANFKRMATRVNYPPYVPLWQRLGFSEEPDDPSMRDTIDSIL